MIYLMYKSAKFGLVLVTYINIHYLTVTLLNNSVELSSNLDPELKEWIENSAAHPILIELLSGSIGWGAGLQSSRQSKSSNPVKVL